MLLPKRQQDLLIAQAALAGIQFEKYRPRDNGADHMWRWCLPDGTWRQYGMFSLVRAAIKGLNEAGHLSNDAAAEYLRLTNVSSDRSDRGPVTELPSEEYGNDERTTV